MIRLYFISSVLENKFGLLGKAADFILCRNDYQKLNHFTSAHIDAYAAWDKMISTKGKHRIYLTDSIYNTIDCFQSSLSLNRKKNLLAFSIAEVEVSEYFCFGILANLAHIFMDKEGTLRSLPKDSVKWNSIYLYDKDIGPVKSCTQFEGFSVTYG